MAYFTFKSQLLSMYSNERDYNYCHSVEKLEAVLTLTVIQIHHVQISKAWLITANYSVVVY